MEELIALQKREEAAQKAAAEKEEQSARRVTQAVVQESQSTAQKAKEKGITISEGAPQVNQTQVAEITPQSKQDGKRKAGEQTGAPHATRQRTESGGRNAMVPVTVTAVTDSQLVIHQHPLFGEMVPFKQDAPFPSRETATLLNNPLYALKLARSVVPVPDRQYVLRRNMAGVFSDIIDLSMKVRITWCRVLALGLVVF